MYKNITIAAIIIIILSGCSIRDYMVVDDVVKETKNKDLPTRACLIDMVNGIALNCKPAFTDKFIKGSPCENSSSSNKCRNYVVDRIMVESDRICTNHKGAIQGNSAGINISLGLTTLLTAGVASIVSGPASNTWAAVSTFSGATRETINSATYQNMLSEAIIAEISSIREPLRLDIKSKLLSSTSNYLPGQAVIDALNYHDKCSFYEGLVSLMKKAGQTERDDSNWYTGSIDSIDADIGSIKKELEKIKDAPDSDRYKKLMSDLTGLESTRRYLKLISLTTSRSKYNQDDGDESPPKANKNPNKSPNGGGGSISIDPKDPKDPNGGLDAMVIESPAPKDPDPKVKVLEQTLDGGNTTTEKK